MNLINNPKYIFMPLELHITKIPSFENLKIRCPKKKKGYVITEKSVKTIKSLLSKLWKMDIISQAI